VGRTLKEVIKTWDIKKGAVVLNTRGAFFIDSFDS